MISVIICSIDDAKFSAVSANVKSLLADEPHEILRISDAKGMCEGYNRGLDQSQGDLLIFCHDDIEILTPDFATRLKKHLETYDVIGVAGTDLMCGPVWIHGGLHHIFGQVAHFNPDFKSFDILLFSTRLRVAPAIQALDGLFLAFRRSVIERLRWDDTTFPNFHFYDLDTTFRAYLAGFRMGVACDIQLIHRSRGIYTSDWHAASDKFAQKHAGKFEPRPANKFNMAGIRVMNKAEVMPAMTPPYWND